MIVLRFAETKFCRQQTDLAREPCPAVMAGGMNGRGVSQHWIEWTGEDAEAMRLQLLGKGSFNNCRAAIDLGREPSPTVTVEGLGPVNRGAYAVVEGGSGVDANAGAGKPPYRVPSMAEVAALPWNGRNVVSTFSGCGGSCLGYRMAGYRVLWASEFIPEARKTYKANHPGSILDGRDIRTVRPEDILDAIGMRPGELDLLDGSPPCASFSTAGKRQAGWGKSKKYSDTVQRTDDLFPEYARILRGLRPRTFVAENVSGLVKGAAKGYFKAILAELKSCGYRVEARVLDAQWLGVPQTRSRLIFQGVREDLGLAPAFPKPLPYRYSVLEAIPWLDGSRAIHDTRGQPQFSAGDFTDSPSPTVTASRPHTWLVEQGANAEFGAEKYRPVDASPSGTIGASVNTGNGRSAPSTLRVTDTASGKVLRRRFTIEEVRRICSFPDDFVLTGTFAQQWERCGRAVPPLMMRAIAEAIRDGVLC